MQVLQATFSFKILASLQSSLTDSSRIYCFMEAEAVVVLLTFNANCTNRFILYLLGKSSNDGDE